MNYRLLSLLQPKYTENRIIIAIFITKCIVFGTLEDTKVSKE